MPRKRSSPPAPATRTWLVRDGHGDIIESGTGKVARRWGRLLAGYLVMTRIATIVVFFGIWGCSKEPTTPPPPSTTPSPAATVSSGRAPQGRPTPYDPTTFRDDIARLISATHYRQAVDFVKAADVERQLAADGSGYMGIGYDTILLPGVHPEIEFDGSRDWYVPGTSDAITPETSEWQSVASEFAERYNLRRRGMGG